MKPITKETINILRAHETEDRIKNFENSLAMIGAVFAYMTTVANEKDCAEIVKHTMRRIGWTQ